MQAIDRKTRTFLAIFEGLHPKFDVGRSHIPRNNGGRGLIAIKDCVELAVRCLKVHVHGSKERLLQDGMRDKVDDLEAATLDLENLDSLEFEQDTLNTWKKL